MVKQTLFITLNALVRKICDVLPNTRFMTIDGSGHVVYLEKPDVFWGTLLTFAAGRSLSFDA